MDIENDQSRAAEETADDSVAVVQKLFIKHTNSIRGFLFAISVDQHLVDDCMHSTFLVITAKADQYDPEREFIPWARGVAKNELLKLRGSQGRGPLLLPPDAIEQLMLTAPEFPENDERTAYLVECIKQLAPRTHQALLLRYRDATMPKEIARIMSLAVDSVHVTLSRARKFLLQCVERKMREETP